MDKNGKKAGIGDLLLAFRRKINESTKGNFLKENLTLSQLEVLSFIHESGKRSMESIADYLRITPPSATSMVEKMEKRKLVKRTKAKDDRRIVFIELTPNTKKHIDMMSKTKEKILNNIVSRLSAADKKHLERIIGILVK